MAGFDMEFPEDMFGGLLANDAEEICAYALEAAAPILVESMKKSASAVIMHEGESEMVQSIKASKPKQTKDKSAHIINVGPTGNSKHTYYDSKSKKKRKYKVSNVLKAIWKEYGIAGRQSASPFIANATNNAEEAVMQKLQEAYNGRAGVGDGPQQ